MEKCITNKPYLMQLVCSICSSHDNCWNIIGNVPICKKKTCVQKFQPIRIKIISLLGAGGGGYFGRHFELCKALKQLVLNTSLKHLFLSVNGAEEQKYRPFLGADFINWENKECLQCIFWLKHYGSVATTNFCTNWPKFQNRCFFFI